MTTGTEHDESEPRRALSEQLELVTWPPRIGARIHYNSGWAHTSWTGEVRAIVDDEWFVYRVALVGSPFEGPTHDDLSKEGE